MTVAAFALRPTRYPSLQRATVAEALCCMLHATPMDVQDVGHGGRGRYYSVPIATSINLQRCGRALGAMPRNFGKRGMPWK